MSDPQTTQLQESISSTSTTTSKATAAPSPILLIPVRLAPPTIAQEWAARSPAAISAEDSWLLLASQLYSQYLKGSSTCLALTALTCNVSSVGMKRSHCNTCDEGKDNTCDEGKVTQAQHFTSASSAPSATSTPTSFSSSTSSCSPTPSTLKQTADARSDRAAGAQYHLTVAAKVKTVPALDTSAGVDATLAAAPFFNTAVTAVLGRALAKLNQHARAPALGGDVAAKHRGQQTISSCTLHASFTAVDAALNHRNLKSKRPSPFHLHTARAPAAIAAEAGEGSRKKRDCVQATGPREAFVATLAASGFIHPRFKPFLLDQMPTAAVPGEETPSNGTPPTVAGACWLANVLLAVFATLHPLSTKRLLKALHLTLGALILPSMREQRAYERAVAHGRQCLHDHRQGSAWRTDEEAQEAAALLNGISAWHNVVCAFSIMLAAADPGVGTLAGGAAGVSHVPWLSPPVFDAHALWCFHRHGTCDTRTSDPAQLMWSQNLEVWQRLLRG